MMLGVPKLNGNKEIDATEKADAMRLVWDGEQAVAVKRVGNIINAIERYCLDRLEIIGIGFCVIKKHAQPKDTARISDEQNRLQLAKDQADQDLQKIAARLQNNDTIARTMTKADAEQSLIESRFGVKVAFDAGRIVYKETIANVIEKMQGTCAISETNGETAVLVGSA